MKEHIQHQPTTEIVWPNIGTVEINPSIDFAYIMRKDGNFTMSPVARNIASEYFLDELQTKQLLMEEYDVFFSKLADILQWGYSYKGNFQLHVFDPERLDTEVRQKAEQSPIVSLDPLMNQGVLEHKVSRGYYLGGKKDFGQVSRPGSKSLSTQATDIASTVQGEPVSVAEDDIFSGGSVIRSLTELMNNGVVIKQLIPGIQVGKPSKLSEMGITVDPVVTYETTDGTDIFDKVDLGDPRDYLLGASGLVVKLPNGHYGRTPYILPFVSTTARAGIPIEIEKEFAFKVLQANLEFYSAVEQSLHRPILLKHMDPNVIVYMNEVFGFDENTPMNQVVAWSMDHLDRVWELTNAQGEFQFELAKLELPHNIVFIDINGTLISEHAVDGDIPEEDVIALQQVIITVKEKGISVGLCSDSPLPQLQQFAQTIGIDGPIIAENGNLIYNNGNTLSINSLESSEAYKKIITEEANNMKYEQINDSIAVEFGGKGYDYHSSFWSFGANRETSITVFGPATFIEHLGNVFPGNSAYSVDASPEYNYFAIHPGENYKTNKGKTLNLLSQYGHGIIMIGNSMSDWVEPSTGVQCAFVSGSKITEEITMNAAYVSDKPLIQGVIDSLSTLI